jgi:hypothetical protein
MLTNVDAHFRLSPKSRVTGVLFGGGSVYHPKQRIIKEN